ncbi:hypothetical protein ACFC00_29210 [Streptomyces adustus]|uniref:hypothetical protein n=1 Tax=Streptomyces adustus TaxID=1609272 RepID=UPI0035D913FA
MIEVGLFTLGESLHYLTTALAGHGRAEPDDELATLADDLGHLPLALSQAVAYLDAGVKADGCGSFRVKLVIKLWQVPILNPIIPPGRPNLRLMCCCDSD